MLQLKFNIGDARKTIREAIARIADPTPLYEELGEYLLDVHRQRFIAGVDPDGNAWPPKSAATLERYKRLGYGSLTKPLHGPSGLLSRMLVKFVSRDGVVLGSNQIYARVMQEGAAKGEFGNDRSGNPIPWGRIPPRRWLGLSDENEADIVTLTEDWLSRALDAEQQ